MRSPFLVVFTSLALLACGQSETSMVRARAASQFHCDRGAITVRQTGQPFPRETLYEVSACGHVVTFRCTRPILDDLQTSMPIEGNEDNARTWCAAEATAAPVAPQ